MEQKVLRISTLVIAGALLLRLLSAAAPEISVSAEMVSLMLFFQTGRLMRPANISFTPEPTDPPP